MKTTLTFLALFLALLTVPAQAQMADRVYPMPRVVQPAGTAFAAAVTREMTTRLHLNEAQYLQLLPVNRIRLVELRTINEQYKDDDATRTAKVAELEAYYEQECSRILTPSQLSQLREQQPATTPAADESGRG